MSINFLFDCIDQAKNLGSYKLANRAFAVLLALAGRDDNDLGVYLESDFDTCEEALEDYYALLVIASNSGQYACIPVPLIKMEGMNLNFLVAAKTQHNRKWFDLPTEVQDLLLASLEWSLWKIYPEAGQEEARFLVEPTVFDAPTPPSVFEFSSKIWTAFKKPSYWQFRKSSLLPQESWSFNDMTAWDVLSYVPSLIRDGYFYLWEVD